MFRYLKKCGERTPCHPVFPFGAPGVLSVHAHGRHCLPMENYPLTGTSQSLDANGRTVVPSLHLTSPMDIIVSANNVVAAPHTFNYFKKNI
jgi:hypothetical protein